MNKDKLPDEFFIKYYNAKFEIAKKIYPEINDIFNDNNNDNTTLPFLHAASSHDYLKKCLRVYNHSAKPIEYIYKDFLYSLAELIDTLKENASSIEILYIYMYIFYNGYTTEDKKFNFIYPDKELLFRLGLSMFTGKSVCRNIGALFKDLLDIFDIESYGIITDRLTYESDTILMADEYINLTKTDTDEEFIQTFNERVCSNKGGTTSTGNHFEVIVKENNIWRLLDPSTGGAYKITKEKTEYPSNYYLRYWHLYASGLTSLSKTVKLYNTFNNTYLKTYKSDKFINTQKKCFDVCEKNKHKIIKFHEKQKENINILSLCLPKKAD